MMRTHNLGAIVEYAHTHTRHGMAQSPRRPSALSTHCALYWFSCSNSYSLAANPAANARRNWRDDWEEIHSQLLSIWYHISHFILTHVSLIDCEISHYTWSKSVVFILYWQYLIHKVDALNSANICWTQKQTHKQCMRRAKSEIWWCLWHTGKCESECLCL